MLTFVFGNKSKEDAFAMRDLFSSALVGIPGFIENEIMVSSIIHDNEGNEYPDGEGIYDCDGVIYNHVVMVTLQSDNQPNGTPEFVFGVNSESNNMVSYLSLIKNKS